jgi:predicted metal-dependent hydrolase
MESHSSYLNRLFRAGDFFMETREEGRRTLRHREVGDIVFTKMKRSRCIRISLRLAQPVHVTLPYHVSYAEADKLVCEKIAWIKEEQARLQERAQHVRHFSDEEIERYRQQAKQFLPPRVATLAARFGFAYGKITVKNIRSRWGSCSVQNNLNFSIYLMHLPDELVDYVILHELCHTVHKNHGVRFWAMLDGVSGGKARAYSEALKKYSSHML